METPPQNEFGRALPYLTLVSEVGLALAVPMLAGAFLGIWIDRSIGTYPVITLLGLFTGMAAGGLGTYRLVRRFLDRFALEPPSERARGVEADPRKRRRGAGRGAP